MVRFCVQRQITTSREHVHPGREAGGINPKETVMRGYRGFIVAGVVAIMATSGAWSVASAQAPAAGQTEPQKPVFTLAGDAAVLTFLIKPDKTADFEMVLGRLKDALHKSENSRRHEQAAGWTVFKSSEMAQGNAVYVMRIDPVVKGEEYDITRLIAEVFPVEVQELFLKYKEAFAGRGVTELTRVLAMNQ
jgi:hypothetical protein